ncbi:hypothetical protein OH77DRAFT_1501916 [Trametes cingulata]|nr:hypothetical protein OH77DRAFT_1501916 [Trametes cingulata]
MTKKLRPKGLLSSTKKLFQGKRARLADDIAPSQPFILVWSQPGSSETSATPYPGETSPPNEVAIQSIVPLDCGTDVCNANRQPTAPLRFSVTVEEEDEHESDSDERGESQDEEGEDNDSDAPPNPYAPSSRQKASCDQHGRHAQQAIYDRENPPQVTETCPRCSASLDHGANAPGALYRCDDCVFSSPQCRDCLLQTHTTHPFDRIAVWDEHAQTWSRYTLAQLGYRGIVKMSVRFCQCSPCASPTAQLIEAGLWPATWKRPRTAMTLGVMDTYRMLSRQAQISVDDFVRHLERLTNDVLPDKVSDRYREFNNTSRQYDHLRRCCEYDASVGEQLERGELCLLCPACPQPGVNMRPGWDKRLPQYQYLDALHASIDGNFHLSLKDRDTDPLDIALTAGAGYFVHEDDFKKFMAKAKKPAKECNQFGAMGQGKYKGKVSGIIGISCRHMFMLPHSIVDLVRAEQYMFVDFAVLSALQRYLKLLLLFTTYDINCQYMIRLRKRLEDYGVVLEELDSIDSAEIPDIIARVGKYHLSMHTRECRYKFSLHTLPGACMSDGEILERVWAITNGVSLRTKEMSAGHRHDVLDGHFEDMNQHRLHVLVDELVHKHKQAVKHLVDLEKYMSGIEGSIGATHVAQWRAEETEYLTAVVDITKHKNLYNPYEPQADIALTTKDIIEQMAEEHIQASDVQGMECVAALEDALALLETRRQLRTQIERFDGSADERLLLSSRVDRWYAEATRVAEDLASTVGACVEVATAGVPPAERGEGFPLQHPSNDKAHKVTEAPAPPACDRGSAKGKRTRGDSELSAMSARLDSAPILLPSDYHSQVRSHDAMANLAKMELRLREGQANDALEHLRVHLTTQMSLADHKTHGSGTAHNTAMDKRIHGKRDAIERAKYAYRLARHAMLVLGMTKEQRKKYRQLKDDDCKAFVLVDEELRAGDSQRRPTWIWGDFTYMDKLDEGKIKLFITHSVKVHWLRQNALRARWKEEVLIRREEMYRTLESFQYSVALWDERARTHEVGGRQGRSAFAQR